MLPSMSALPSPPSSRLETVLRAGQMARSTGAALGGAQTQDNAAIINAQKAKDARMERQKAKVAAAEEKKRLEAKTTAKAQQEERDFLAERFKNIRDKEERDRAKQRLVAKMRRDFTKKIYTSFDLVDQIENEQLDTLEILSFTEATTYRANLQKINDIYEDALTTEGLLATMKDEANLYISTNQEEIKRMDDYLPKIKRAMDADFAMRRKPAADQEAKMNALRANFMAKEEKMAKEMLEDQKALQQDRKRDQERIEELQLRLKEADRKAAMREAQMQKTSEDGMAALQKRIRAFEDEVAEAKAQAVAAEQAAEKCNFMLAKEAQANALTEETYQRLQMDVAQKRAVHEINSQKTDKARDVLQGLESQLEDAMAQAKSTYNEYVDWEQQKDCSGKWLFRGKSCDEIRHDYLIKIAATKRAEQALIKQVEAARSEHDASYTAWLNSYTKQQVAVAVMEAAKQHMSKTDGPVNVVVGKPM